MFYLVLDYYFNNERFASLYLWSAVFIPGCHQYIYECSIYFSTIILIVNALPHFIYGALSLSQGVINIFMNVLFSSRLLFNAVSLLYPAISIYEVI